MINGTEWKTNDSFPKRDDGKGNVNNILEVKEVSRASVAQITPVQSGTSEWTFNDIRYARKKLNAVHEECTKHNAEIFLHEQTPDVLVIIRQFSFDHDP